MADKKPLVIGETVPLRTATAGDTLVLPASVSGGASIRIPHGVTPSSPANGDVWTTTAGVYARVNGVSVGPLAPADTGIIPTSRGGLGVDGSSLGKYFFTYDTQLGAMTPSAWYPRYVATKAETYYEIAATPPFPASPGSIRLHYDNLVTNNWTMRLQHGGNYIEVSEAGYAWTSILIVDELDVGSSLYSPNGSFDNLFSGASIVGKECIGAHGQGSAAWSSDVDNYALSPYVRWLRVTPSGSGNRILTGMQGGEVGRRVLITNISTTQPLYFAHDSSSSSASNRILCPQNANYVLFHNASVELIYDSGSSRWRVLNNG